MKPILPGGDPTSWSFDTVDKVLVNVFDFLKYVGSGIAVLFILYGAFLYITAFGEEKKAEQGKTIVTWAIVGLAIIILSRPIIVEIWTFFAGSPPPFTF